jgi:hypothetical protein
MAKPQKHQTIKPSYYLLLKTLNSFSLFTPFLNTQQQQQQQQQHLHDNANPLAREKNVSNVVTSFGDI